MEIALGSPIECCFRKCGIGIARGNISRATWGRFEKDSSTAGVLKGTDDLKHAVTYAGPKVDSIAARFLQCFNGFKMTEGKVNNMNVISHACAIGSRVIRPPDL
jgi:hypothetical protein